MQNPGKFYRTENYLSYSVILALFFFFFSLLFSRVFPAKQKWDTEIKQ